MTRHCSECLLSVLICFLLVYDLLIVFRACCCMLWQASENFSLCILNMKINPLECPHCHEKAAEYYELFIGMSRLHREKKCQSCSRKIKFNINTLIWMCFSMILGIVVLILIDVVLPINSWVGKIFGVFCFCAPILFGQKLFLPKD